MDELLGNIGSRVTGGNYQGIFPEVSFTCSGSIKKWVFGVEMGGGDLFPELQIWRPTGDDGVYTKVGKTTVMVDSNSIGIYEYPLSSPLTFQAGDVLGYYQPNIYLSQLRLLLEVNGREPQRGYYYYRTSPASELDIRLGASRSTAFQILVDVVTDPPGCGCGFMSVERMEYINVDTEPRLVNVDQRQQISPEMRFTCDGVITKWIIGAEFMSGNLNPELQIWRNVGNRTYEKINGTLFQTGISVFSNIYESDNFSPIPVKSGDILGIFTPPREQARLRLRTEIANGPTQYYLATGSSDISPHSVIDIQQSHLVLTDTYHPLVSVEFVRQSPSTDKILPSPPSIERTEGSGRAVTSFPAVTPTQCNTNTERESDVYVSVGLSVAVVVLIAAVLILISVTVCLRQRKRKKKLLITTENVAYGTSSVNMELKDNVAYTSTATKENKDDDGKYDYVSRSVVTATPNPSCDVPTRHTD